MPYCDWPALICKPAAAHWVCSAASGSSPKSHPQAPRVKVTRLGPTAGLKVGDGGDDLLADHLDGSQLRDVLDAAVCHLDPHGG